MLKTALVLLLTWAAAAQTVPTPASHFGHPIGVDRELLDWDKVVSYFQALAASSNKIVVKELGKTAEGRPFIAATISSPETIRNLNTTSTFRRGSPIPARRRRPKPSG